MRRRFWSYRGSSLRASFLSGPGGFCANQLMILACNADEASLQRDLVASPPSGLGVPRSRWGLLAASGRWGASAPPKRGRGAQRIGGFPLGSRLGRVHRGWGTDAPEGVVGERVPGRVVGSSRGVRCQKHLKKNCTICGKMTPSTSNSFIAQWFRKIPLNVFAARARHRGSNLPHPRAW